MKGADQCPVCESKNTDELRQNITGYYAGTFRVCGQCAAAWEGFAIEDLLDPEDELSSFVEPCDNCAFRPGSPEQNDKEKWGQLLAQLKSDPYAGFYCHKGVPLDPEGETGFKYPKTPNEMRVCRGYLNMMAALFDKIRRKRLSKTTTGDP